MMDGYFDNSGGSGGGGGGFDLLNSLRGVGMNPDSIDPRDQNAARMMVLTAMGNQMQGGTSFFDSLGSIGDRADARQMKQLQMMELLNKIQEQKGVFAAQADATRIMSGQQPGQQPGVPGGGAAPMTAGTGGAPTTGLPAATMDQGQGAPAAQQVGAQPGVPGGTADSNKIYANMYRQAARRYVGVQGGAEIAKQFEDIANKYDPPEEFGPEPRPMVGPDGKIGMYLVGKKGTLKSLDSLSPVPKLSRPFATQGGMAAMDEATGATRVLTGDGGQPMMPHDPDPATIKEYQLAQQQGYKGDFNSWMIAKARAGAPSTSIRVGNTLGQDVAAGIAKQIMTNQTQAQAASDQLQNIAQIRQALQDGAITGPLANLRVMGARVLSATTGAKPEILQKLGATASAVQAMARSNVTAAQALNGQGQISDGERILVEKAANGSQEMTGPELLATTAATEKVARLTLDGYQRQVQALGKTPGLEMLKPFYEATFPNGSVESAKQGAPGVPGSKVGPGGSVLNPKGIPSFNGPLTSPQPASTATAGGAPDLRTAAAKELERRRQQRSK